MSRLRPSPSVNPVASLSWAHTTAVAAFVVAGFVLAACGSGSNVAAGSANGPSASNNSTTSDAAQAQVGDLVVSGGFVPQPASPDVAAAYLIITNTGDADDTLTTATSDAGTATLHRTVGGAMVPLGQLPIPAHTAAGFEPGANHIMIENMTRSLVKGDAVRLTLTFQRAGEVTVDVPVTGYPTGGDGMGGMDMHGADDMDTGGSNGVDGTS